MHNYFSRLEHNPGPSAAVSILCLVPSGLYAVITNDSLPVIIGTAIGTFTGVWAIYVAAEDRIVKRLQRQLVQSEDENDRLRQRYRSMNDQLGSGDYRKVPESEMPKPRPRTPDPDAKRPNH